MSWWGVSLAGNSSVGNCPDESYPVRIFSLVGVFRVGIVRYKSSEWQ